MCINFSGVKQIFTLSQTDVKQINPAKYRYCLLIVLTLIMASCAKAPQLVEIPTPPPQLEIKPEPLPELNSFDRWQILVQKNRYASTYKKLINVNEFFNQFEFVDDIYLWGQTDYWATLPETLNKNSGDCEDFTIAKYFTLKELNVPENQMRITYVISLKTNEPHMVLLFMPNSSEEPIVLDINNNFISPISRRQDLIPVYCFNSYGYWIAKREEGWRGKRIGDSSKLSMWENVLQRMDQLKLGSSDG